MIIFEYFVPISIGNVLQPIAMSPSISSMSLIISRLRLVIKAKKAKAEVTSQACLQAMLSVISEPLEILSAANSKDTTSSAVRAVSIATTRLPTSICFLNVVE